jgi:hypothetical protein
MEQKEVVKASWWALLDRYIRLKVYISFHGKKIAMGNSGGSEYCA